MATTVLSIQNKIAEVIINGVPKEAEVSRIEFEGPIVAVYIKKPEILMDQNRIVSDIVNLIKKRIVIRSDPSVRMNEREAEKKILDMIPVEAEITNIFFDPTIGEVVIETKKPGLVIGKNGSSLQEITKATKWRPRILRSPPLPSKIISNIRHYLHTESKERERILRATGERIFRETLLSSDDICLTAFGGFKEVGRSAILVHTSESRVLLDCGINAGSRNPLNAFPRLGSDVFDIESLDAVVISHAHLDHCGFLPFLYKYGYDGPVYCSEPTASLMTLLQLDYLDVAKGEGSFAPYDQKDVRNTVLHTIPIKEGSVTDISPDIRLTIHNSGHILGSTLVHLHIGEGLHNIVYTGDFKYGRTWLLEPATTDFPRVETLIVECTYGAPNDVMPNRKEAEAKLVSIINASLEKRGKILIPVPAVGRAQEILLVIDGYMKNGLLKEAPVYIDGMVNEATAIHTAYPEYLERSVRDLIFHKEINPFQSDYFINVKNLSSRQEVVDSGPAVILATSGMLEGGPSVEYFKGMAADENNALLFVSYQIEGTLGHRVQKGLKEVPLMSPEGKVNVIEVKLRVEGVEGFSGHSDRNQILSYLRKISPRPERVIVNHGEKYKCLSMADTIRKAFGIEAYTPNVLETIRLK
ncbi:MAG: beta-CASP ribonuclease aCPSF1 [Candidatus Bathyarchaeota archaeon]